LLWVPLTDGSTFDSCYETSK